MKIGERYEDDHQGFNSIRDDAKGMVDQIADGKIDMLERATNVWMKIARGDIADRFDKIRDTYLAVTKDTKNQIEREHTILEAYRDFRGALKQAEVMALEVLKIAEAKLDESQDGARDRGRRGWRVRRHRARRAREARTRPRREAARHCRTRSKRYQIAKDLSDNLTIGYNTSEVIMARLMQTTNAKERVYQQAVSFFSTNETVLTALKASFTGMFGLHESTETLNAMKEGVSKIARDALRDRRQGAGGGAVRPATARRSAPTRSRSWSTRVVNFQEKSRNHHRRDAQAGDARTRPRSAMRSKTARGASRSSPRDGNALLLETRRLMDRGESHDQHGCADARPKPQHRSTT